MMKDKVIQTTGRIWKLLGEKGPISVSQLAKSLKASEEITNQAVGWLAREDKIKYIKKGTRFIISLVDTEQQIYNMLSQKPVLANQ